ncbi:unnamed protein product [Boreogadus saida]
MTLMVIGPNHYHSRPNHHHCKPNYHHCKPNYHHCKPNYHHCKPNYHHCRPNYHHCRPNYHHCRPNYHHCKPNYHHCKPNYHHCKPNYHHCKPNYHHCKPNYHHCRPNYHHCKPNYHHCKPNYHHCKPNYHHPVPNLPQQTVSYSSQSNSSSILRSRHQQFQSEMRCVWVHVEHAKAHVICNETSMTVELEKAAFKGLDEDHLRLNDPGNTACRLHSNGTHVIGFIPLNECGTMIKEDDENLLFSNEITTFEDVRDIVTRKHLLEVQFSCQYPKRGNVSLGFTVHRDNQTITEKGFGTFTYNFEFYPDILFDTMINPHFYPLDYEVGDKIYMQIDATTSINNTVLFVESCSASPYDNPNYQPTYPIIENGCVQDSTVVIYPPSQNKQFRFSIDAFKFIGLHDQVYISCSVILCEAGNLNTRCSRGCLPTPHNGRRRRSALTETGAHFISQGPLRLQSTPENKSSVTGLNLNMAFIAGCLLAAIALICGVMIHKYKRTAVRYQPLSSIEQ